MQLPPSEIGLGLRPCHYAYIEKNQPHLAFFEILSDNYLTLAGHRLYHLEKILLTYPVTLHGVGMSLGSKDPLNFAYLTKLKKLIEFTKPLLVSDHLCWTSFGNRYFHDLLPLPYNHETIEHIVPRIKQVQDFLGCHIAIENVSSYLNFVTSSLTEWEFIKIICEKAKCKFLLDLNNIFVSAYNNNYQVEDFLNHIPTSYVAQFHLAGFSKKENYLLDTHGDAIHSDVWDIYHKALAIYGPKATVIERDNQIPPFEMLFEEVKLAKNIMSQYVKLI